MMVQGSWTAGGAGRVKIGRGLYGFGSGMVGNLGGWGIPPP